MIARDKQLHFIAGAAIAVLFIFWAGPMWALIAAAVAGAAKEARDHLCRCGSVEMMDFVWTGAGGAAVVLAWAGACIVIGD